MARRVTMADARRQWAKVLRVAESGTPVEVTRNGKPVAALIPIEDLRRIEALEKESLASVLEWFESNVDRTDLDGPDPWEDVRDASAGRGFEFET